MNAIGLALAAVLVLGDPPSNPPATEAPRDENAKPELSTPASPSASSPPVPFPHPLITEVLYAVPNSPEGDVNQDGTRHAAGDEFVELVNPHDKPIQLLGYTITDRNPEKKGQLKFTFPVFELPPGGVVVVFNGCESTWSGVGEVGDSKKAPAAPNESFGGAFVFTMRAPSSRTSWANGGDYVLLSDPNSQPIHVVSWGTFNEPIPQAKLAEVAPITTRGSVQRTSLDGVFIAHSPAKDTPKVAWSPGVFDVRPAKAPAPEKPAQAQPGKPAPQPDRK